MFTTTAKSLGQLRSMKVMNCASLEEIVSEQRNEDEQGEAGKNAGEVDRIVFRQLKALELVSLESLKSFCSSKSSVFEFPALEKVVVSVCPNLEKFSENFPQDVKSTPILQKVYVVRENEKRWYWKDNLQATLQYMFHNKKYFEGMDELSVDEHVDLEQAWQGKGSLQKDWFYSLTTLKLLYCKFETFAIPSNVVHYLKTLKELKVLDCDNIASIFEMGEAEFSGTLKLKKLTLIGLPNVTHVWQEGKQGISRFQNLQHVTVADCMKLKALFPVALARDLKKLEKLEISYCRELLGIVAKEEEEEEEEEAAEGTQEFVFPRLTTLELAWLPELTYFYSERFTLECPELYTLQVIECNKLKLFQSEEEVQGSSTSVVTQPLFSDLKELRLNWNGSSTTLPLEILEMTPNLETMQIEECRSMKELFPSGNPHDGGMLANLKQLFLFGLSEPHSMGGLEYSSPNLQLLYVADCPLLKTFAQSFSNLRLLYIWDFHGLECLFTSAAAKMLLNLEELYIVRCESLKEIVGKEDETTSTQQEIKFERLKRITLIDLSGLECFYSGNSTLLLPSLVQVDIHECPKMTTFSQGWIPPESSTGIQVSYDDDGDLVFDHNLNHAVAVSFLHENKLVLAEYPHLKEKWLGRVPLPDNWSSFKLKHLVVEGCGFLSDWVLPSHLLPLLSNLEELVVRNCDSVEAIFDVKDTPTTHHDGDDSNMIVIPLKELTLEQLPSLRHVWNKDPKGRLSLPVLREVIVKQCKSIKSLFPASTVAIGNLERLDVRNCVELMEIVAKDEAAAEEGTKETAMFPRVTWLVLRDLPNLRCICSGMHILDMPVLDVLDVYRCPKLKIFATDFQNSLDSNPEGQDHFTTDNQGFVSAEKVTAPHLKTRSLNKEDVIMIEQGRIHVDLRNIENLILQSFDEDSDAFPDIFFKEVPLPNVQEFTVADSAFQEIFLSQRPDFDYTQILSRLKVLELRSLHKLKSIGLEHTRMAPLLESLQKLTVRECSCLTNLAPSTVSFSQLTWLKVKDCARLEYLFTSSTAKTLVALRRMVIANCESLEKVVAAEEGDKPDEDVIFRGLATLSLSELPKLGSFYTGNSTMNFPWLDDVSITQCKSMKTFYHGNMEAPRVLSRVKIDGIRCEGDLNTAVRQHFEKGSSPELA